MPEVEFEITQTKHIRITINQDRITLKHDSWDIDLMEWAEVLALCAYDVYVESGETKTKRGNMEEDGRIVWRK